MNTKTIFAVLTLITSTGCAFEAHDAPVDCSFTESLEFAPSVTRGDEYLYAYQNGTVFNKGGKVSSFIDAGGAGVAFAEGRTFLLNSKGEVLELSEGLVAEPTGCMR